MCSLRNSPDLPTSCSRRRTTCAFSVGVRNLQSSGKSSMNHGEMQPTTNVKMPSIAKIQLA